MPKKAGAGKKPDPGVRHGAKIVEVYNSGLEVWLYDGANAEAIIDSGAMEDITGGPNTKFGDILKQGLLMAYGLRQDDQVHVAVAAGEPLTADEMAAARWLEPQTAFLRLPSGKLRVESNDACRLLPEEPTDAGAMVDLPPGDYRVTIHRIDHESLAREGMKWGGVQEVITLTPGGSPFDAVDNILPFAPRRDLIWVGKYAIQGNKLEGLAWFDDYWDTYVVNIDAAAAARLGLVHGKYFKTTVPDAGISLITVFAGSWEAGAALPRPDVEPLDEYGYGSLSPMGAWDNAEALLCRRSKTKTGIGEKQKKVWLPAVVEVLDAAPAHPRAKGELLKAGGRVYFKSDLGDKEYFEFDAGFLPMMLSGRINGVSEDDVLPLSKAVNLVDGVMKRGGLKPLGDFEFDLNGDEFTIRIYAGSSGTLGLILAAAPYFELFFLSPLEDGNWLVTGTEDFPDSWGLEGREDITFDSPDGDVALLMAGHGKRAKKEKSAPRPAPASLERGVKLFHEFLAGK